MRGALLICLLVLLLLSFNPKIAFAESSYVLPYPSAMPGSIFYRLNLIQEELLRFWFFGDFGQFHYNLKQSDKYLVEAKTLFDYKQHLLAYNALQKSNDYFKQIEPVITSAKQKYKETIEKEKKLREAAQKHIEEISKLTQNLPDVIEWTPEGEQTRNLNISKLFMESIEIRKKLL